MSVESLVAGGVISHLALTGRFPPAENFRETGFFIPAALDPGSRSRPRPGDPGRRRPPGTHRVLHTEIKSAPDGPRIIEVNGRVGGGVPEMLQRAAGINLVELPLGSPWARLFVDGPVATDRIGYRFLLQPPPSRRR